MIQDQVVDGFVTAITGDEFAVMKNTSSLDRAAQTASETHSATDSDVASHAAVPIILDLGSFYSFRADLIWTSASFFNSSG